MLNLVVAFLFAFVVSFVLIYFISAHDRKLRKQTSQALLNANRDQSKTARELDDDKQAAFRQFTKFVTDLCEYLKLEIQDVTRPDDFEVVVRACNINPLTRVDYLVVGFMLDESETIDTNLISAISDQIISERISKGIIITTGNIPDSIKAMPELAPIEFLDKTKVAEWKAKIIL